MPKLHLFPSTSILPGQQQKYLIHFVQQPFFHRKDVCSVQIALLRFSHSLVQTMFKPSSVKFTNQLLVSLLFEHGHFSGELRPPITSCLDFCQTKKHVATFCPPNPNPRLGSLGADGDGHGDPQLRRHAVGLRQHLGRAEGGLQLEAWS